MKQRSLLAMLVWTLLTAGLYQLYWLYSTKEDMRDRGADIPSFIFWFIPLVNIWWLWRYASGIAFITDRDDYRLLMFVLFLFGGGVAPFVAQHTFNRITPPPLLPPAVARRA